MKRAKSREEDKEQEATPETRNKKGSSLVEESQRTKAASITKGVKDKKLGFESTVTPRLA